MGHSFGGTIALEYASRYPQNVEKLIILDGAADMPVTFTLWKKQLEQRYPAESHSTLDGPAGNTLKRAEASHNRCAIAKAEFSAEMTTLQKVGKQAFHDWQQFHNQGPLQQQKALDQASGLQNTGEISSAYFGEGSDFPCYRFTAFDRLTMPMLVIVGRYDGAIGSKSSTVDRTCDQCLTDNGEVSGWLCIKEQVQLCNPVPVQDANIDATGENRAIRHAECPRDACDIVIRCH